MSGIRPLSRRRKEALLAYLSQLLLLVLHLLFLRLYLRQQSALLRPFLIRLEAGCGSEGLLGSMPLLACDRNVSLVMTRQAGKYPYHSCAFPEASQPEAPALALGWLYRTFWRLTKVIQRCRSRDLQSSPTSPNFLPVKKSCGGAQLKAVRNSVARTPLPHIRCGLKSRVLELPTL